ncbi:MAG: alpha-amylase [Treponema sp.]|jgi:glycosidase|nr:alpha-amylase [Treponema sp.]
MNHRIFYHIYPLGFCGAPERNDFSCPAGGGLRSIAGHLPRLAELGVNALYLGPLFESTAHGYDTLDYFWVDRRLGTNADLTALVKASHQVGIAVILDGVLNHTGRHFFAFRDLSERGASSPYRDWYKGIDFSRRSPWGDPFAYEGWHGCYDLVTLNGHNREAREHLFKAARFWIETFDIDGLRLDAADLLLSDVMEELSARCRAVKPDFWLLGEVIHGNYRQWAREGRLDSVTNYELYKSLWSSFNDHNFFELSWTLNRQFGPDGLYRGLALYNFLDNHDVNRVASTVKNRDHLVPLYGLLFSLPGFPSIYYGSEYGLRGERTRESDRALRPAWNDRPEAMGDEYRPPLNPSALYQAIAGFIRVRKEQAALREGAFRELYRTHEQYAFLREAVPGRGGPVLAAVNSASYPAEITIAPDVSGGKGWRDLMTGSEVSVGTLNLHLAPGEFRLLAGR